MACNDGGPNYSQAEQDRAVFAALCAVVRMHGMELVLKSLDSRTVGAPHGSERWNAFVKHLQTWWREHQEQDARERAREAAAAARALAVSKLTPEEREALGL